MATAMDHWRTNIILRSEFEEIKSDEIKINNGIFQGDSFSPLLFCLALAPLSHQLKKSECGYDVNTVKISHLFFMDDLKLYGRNDAQLESLLHTVAKFSKDIKMNFGLDKCAKATFIRGKLEKSTNIELDRDTTIKDLDQEEFYKYLGVREKDGIQHPKMKELIRKEYYRRVRMVLKSELNTQNKINAINTFAVPVVSYSLNIINWTVDDLKRIDRKTRKFLTMYRTHHPKSDVDRLYLTRQVGGRGLLQIEMSYKLATVGLRKYLEEKDDPFIKAVNHHESTKKKYSVVKEARKFEKNLVINEERENGKAVTDNVRKYKMEVKKNLMATMKEKWEEKQLHGQYPKRLNKADTDRDNTNRWLRSSGLKGET